MLGSRPRSQLEQTPATCLTSSLHFAQSWRTMAVTVLSASMLVSCAGGCEGAGEAGGCDWVAEAC